MRTSLFTAIFCCIVKVFTIVKGRYQAEIIIFQYNNTPPGKCHGCNNLIIKDQLYQGCCDDPVNNGTCIGDDLCDVYFTYCLRLFGSTGRGCSNYAIVTSDVENDTSSFSFPQQNMSDGENDTSNCSFTSSFPQQNMSMNILSPNPLLLPGLSDAYTSEGVQLYTEIWDDDPPERKPDELVDILLIDHNESVGDQSPTQVHSGMYGFVSMELMITVTCIENFQGSDCSQCVSGFTGPDCQQIDNCVGINCSGNGQCVDGIGSFNCSCDPGFTGELCQSDIDDCVGVKCSGNGQCVDGVDSFNCGCDPGFTGELCQSDIDDCVGVKCSGNGQCVDGVDSFSCSCDPGFTGELCQTNIDDCVGVNCSGNGQCVDGVDSFNCGCDPGFTGEMCQTNIDECVGVGCSRNGECLDGVNSFTCECSPGYTGPLCDIQVSRSSFIGSFVGGIVVGVIGMIFVVIILFVILVLVIVALRQKKKQSETNLHKKWRGFQVLPGNNPIYEGNIPVYTTPGFHYERSGPEQDQERECGTHVSGIDKMSDPVYTTPSVNVTPESTLEHRYDNIIYGREPEANTYLVISDLSATTAIYDTVTDKQQ